MKKKINIGVDADNGDSVVVDKTQVPPLEIIVQAVSVIVEENPDIGVVLVGNEGAILKAYDNNPPSSVSIIPSCVKYAPETEFLKPVKGSSLNLLVKAIEDKKIDGFFSIGDTAKICIESTRLKRIRKIHPVLVATMGSANEKKDYLLADAGAMSDSSSHNVYCQGLMAAAYAVYFLRIKKPRVGLLCNGTENHKGNTLVREIDKYFREAIDKKHLSDFLDFQGKVESGDAMDGELDILVADGFTGNVYLKTCEGAIKTGHEIIKQEIEKLRGIDRLSLKIGARGAKAIKKAVKERFNPDLYNGAILLGYNGTIVKGHGASSAEAFYAGIKRTRDFLKGNIDHKIAEVLDKYMLK